METTTLKTVLDFGYKALAQGWWTALGFVVGFAGVFLGAFGANYFGMFNLFKYSHEKLN